jgi:glutaredoxin-like protein NrdH
MTAFRAGRLSKPPGSAILFSMLETLEYIHEEGSDSNHRVVVYALSTCGFCKRAMEYLRGRSIDFRYVYLDLLPLEVKNVAKEELKNRFQRSLVFPFLVVDDSVSLTGFTQERWDEALGSGRPA